MAQTALGRFAFGGETQAPTWSNSWISTVLAGRILLSSVFLIAGVGKLIDFAANVEALAALGFPAPAAFVVIAAVIEIVGGLSVLTGALARLGSALLALYLIPVTIIAHNFWAQSGAELQMELSSFMKNVGLVGGLLLVMAFGAGRISIDSRLKENNRTPAD